MQGFSLIELLVATLILTFELLGGRSADIGNRWVGSAFSIEGNSLHYWGEANADRLQILYQRILLRRI